MFVFVTVTMVVIRWMTDLVFVAVVMIVVYQGRALNRGNPTTAAAAGGFDGLCGLSGNARVHRYYSDQAHESANGPGVQQLSRGFGWAKAYGHGGGVSPLQTYRTKRTELARSSWFVFVSGPSLYEWLASLETRMRMDTNNR